MTGIQWNTVITDTFKGTWNASTNTPTLADGVGTIGDYYDITTGGTQDLGSGNITFLAGDVIKYNGTVWYNLEAPHAATVTTKLTVTADIAASTTLSTTASGTGYTKSLDDGDLTASAAAFERTEKISVFVTGVYMVKEVDAIWVSQTSFQLTNALHSGDIVLILS